jgi:hypothetical protein
MSKPQANNKASKAMRRRKDAAAIAPAAHEKEHQHDHAQHAGFESVLNGVNS